MRTGIRGQPYCLRDIREAPWPGRWQDSVRKDGGVGSHARQADRVVGTGSDDPDHMRSVARYVVGAVTRVDDPTNNGSPGSELTWTSEVPVQ